MFRKDARRSAITTNEPAFPLRQAWSYQCPQPPRPAWPPQPHLLNRTDYDYAAQLVVADGIVCFGSSADDTVRALDLATGLEKWHFIAGGPVRFAPQIHEARVYVAADDGVITCLDLASGRPLWSFDAAPWPDRFIGNGRMMSRWPCRTGVLVVGDTVYATAGLWPADGVYAYALDAATGRVRWVNDTLTYLGQGYIDTLGDHQGEFTFAYAVPQGALLHDRGILLIPQGNANPLRLDATTGELARGGQRFGREVGEQRAAAAVAQHLKQKGEPPPTPEAVERLTRVLANRSPGFPGSGGCWVTIDQGQYVVMAMHRGHQVHLNRWDVATKEGGPWRRAERSIPQLAMGLHRSILPGRISIVIDAGQILARNAYDLALAGDVLLVGERDAIVAVDRETNEERWRAAVPGEVRGISIASGRVLVSADSGRIACFAPPSAVAGAAPAHDPGAALGAAAPAASEADNAVLARLREAGADRGYALLLGADALPMARLLAARTRLHVVLGVRESAIVAELRETLLTTTSLYGSRIHVHELSHGDRLPFAQYFANAVLVYGPLHDLPAAELYRVLRPCGGVLLLPGVSAAAAEAFVQASGAAADECQSEPLAIVRGPLPGASDFDNRPTADPYVKWPLQTLWFGGPDPRQMTDQRSTEEFAGAPAVAYGRFYALGGTSLTASDAYNGAVLWTRPVPKLWRDVRRYHGVVRTVSNVDPHPPPPGHWRTSFKSTVGAFKDHAYLRIGTGVMRGQGKAVAQLDARTGEQLRFAGPYVHGPRLSLATPQTWLFAMPPVETGKPGAPGDKPAAKSDGLDDADDLEDPDIAKWQRMVVPSVAVGRERLTAEGGLLSLRAEADGLVVDLASRDPHVTPFDLWELFFDFRPPSRRYGLYDRGTFLLRIVPALDTDTPARAIAASGEAHPAALVSGRRTDDGTETRVILPWSEVDRLAGGRPTSFDFAATFNADATGGDAKKKIRQRHLFGDAFSGGINVGWATVYLGPVPDDAADEPPAVAALMTEDDRPKGWGHPGAMGGRGIDEAVRTETREHPLTGEVGPKVFRSGAWGCGGPAYSATAVFRRASKPGIGVYDFENDAGLHFFGGVSSSCGNSAIAALGLLVFKDSRFRCDCNPPIKTSLAMAPAERRYHEDWALFYDREVNTRIDRARLNLGAFGDRRDDERAMWLAVPRDVDRAYGYPLQPGTAKGTARPQMAVGHYVRHVPAGLLVPMSVEYEDAFGPYRRNADRVEIKGTETPWIYTSGIAGIRRAVLQLDFLTPLAAPAAVGAIVIDGKLDDSAWKGDAQVALTNTSGRVYFRHDDAKLYIAAHRGPMTSRSGRFQPWAATTEGEDAEVWKDDAFEVFLGHPDGGPVVHLGLSVSGARFDARADADGLEDPKWTASWDAAVQTNESGATFELAVPLALLAEAGIDRDRLGVNVMIDQSDSRGDARKFLGGEGRNWNVRLPTSEALGSLGSDGRRRCAYFAPLGLGTAPEYPRRTFTVKLHFAELEDIAPGQRVFDVSLQGRRLLTDFDIAKEAGVRTAVVKTFTGIVADEELEFEFISRATGDPTAATVPIVSAVEVYAEGFVAPEL